MLTLNEAKDRHISGLKVTVTVGECDSPVFVNESREYAKVLNKILICAKYHKKKKLCIKIQIILLFQKIIPIVDNVEYLLLRNNIDHFDIVEKFLDSNYHLSKLILKCLQPDMNIC